MRVKPEGRDRFLAQLKKEEREVPERFSGCARFAAYTDPADPDSVLLYEEWTTKEAADTTSNPTTSGKPARCCSR